MKHEEFTSLITDDSEFETEEKWLTECQEYFLRIDLGLKTYVESVDAEISKTELQQPAGMIGMQNESAPEEVDSSTQNMGVEMPEEITTATDGSVIYDAQNDVSNVQIGATNNLETTNISTRAMNNEQSCGFQMEKPKLPKFSGDVREYVIFRADFKHTIESRYSKRDAITLLRTCLKDKPLELIQGIGSDYDAAWQYLDSIYGDVRHVSDTITQDIAQFKALQEEEDARFCDLVHL